MFRHYLQSAFRVLRKQKLSTLINLTGLGTGLACFALLTAYIRDELTFDRFHAKADSTYILINEFRERFMGSAHHFIAGRLEAEFPELEPGSTIPYCVNSQVVRHGRQLLAKDFAFAGPGFFRQFSFPLTGAGPDRALASPHQVVLTAATAAALSGGGSLLGQTVSIRIGETYRDFTVSAIMEDIPGNSSLRFDGVLPYSLVFDAFQIDPRNNDFVTLPMFTTIFLNIPDPAKARSVQRKLPAFHDRIYGEMFRKVNLPPPVKGYDLLPLPSHHLSDVSIFSLSSRSNPAYAWILGGVALLILILACFNSINFSLTRHAVRLKEAGLRKTMGASRRQLRSQFLTESALTGLAALVLGLAAALLWIPAFNGLTGKQLTAADLFHPQTVLIILAAVATVSLLAGWSPAWLLARQPAAEIFQGRFLRVRKSRLARALFVLQFTISTFFLTGVLVMTSQLRFLATFDTGYDPANILVLDSQFPDEKAGEAEAFFALLRNELRTEPGVLSVSADSGTVGTAYGSIVRRYDQNGIERTVECFMIGPGFLQTLGIPLLQGRDFPVPGSPGGLEGALVNETLVKEFGIENPVGKRFSDFAVDKLPPEYAFDQTIIGVVKDFHVHSLYEPVGPMAFAWKGFPPVQRYRRILVKIGNGQALPVRQKMETLWSRLRPGLPCVYFFLEDELAGEYRQDENWGRIIGWSAGFALLIAFAGLFGLTALSAVRRTKEVGIRRTLGAGATSILLLFLMDSLKWVALASLLAWPPAWFACREWLAGFAYGIGLNGWFFVLATLLSLLLAGVTVGWHAIRAARIRPAECLRSE